MRSIILLTMMFIPAMIIYAVCDLQEDPNIVKAWWQLIPMAIGAVAGAAQGQANKERMQKEAKFRKAAIQYSPWTGMGDPGMSNLPGEFTSGLKGLAGGAALAGGIESSGLSDSFSSAPKDINNVGDPSLGGNQDILGTADIQPQAPQAQQQTGLGVDTSELSRMANQPAYTVPNMSTPQGGGGGLYASMAQQPNMAIGPQQQFGAGSSMYGGVNRVDPRLMIWQGQ